MVKRNKDVVPVEGKKKKALGAGAKETLQTSTREQEEKQKESEYTEERFYETLEKLKRKKKKLITEKEAMKALIPDWEEEKTNVSDPVVKEVLSIDKKIRKIDSKIAEHTQKFLPYMEFELKPVKVGEMPEAFAKKTRKEKDLVKNINDTLLYGEKEFDIDEWVGQQANDDETLDAYDDILEMMRVWRNKTVVPKKPKEKLESFLKFASDEYSLDLADKIPEIKMLLQEKKGKKKKKMVPIREERVVRKFVEPKAPEEEYEENLIAMGYKEEKEGGGKKKKGVKKSLVFEGISEPTIVPSGKKTKRIPLKISTVLEAPVPTTRVELRRFCKNVGAVLNDEKIMEKITKPLAPLFKKKRFEMDAEQVKAFEKMKRYVQKTTRFADDDVIPLLPKRKDEKPIFFTKKLKKEGEEEGVSKPISVGDALNQKPPLYLRKYVRSLFYSLLFSLKELQLPNASEMVKKYTGTDFKPSSLESMINTEYCKWRIEQFKNDAEMLNFGNIQSKAQKRYQDRKNDPGFFVYEFFEKIDLPIPLPPNMRFTSYDLRVRIRSALHEDPDWMLGGFFLSKLDGINRELNGEELVLFIAKTIDQYLNFYQTKPNEPMPKSNKPMPKSKPKPMPKPNKPKFKPMPKPKPKTKRNYEYEDAYDTVLKDFMHNYLNMHPEYNTQLSDRFARKIVVVDGREINIIDYIKAKHEQLLKKHSKEEADRKAKEAEEKKTKPQRQSTDNLSIFSFDPNIIDDIFDISKIPSEFLEIFEHIRVQIVPFVNAISSFNIDEQLELFNEYFNVTATINDYRKVLDIVLRVNVLEFETRLFEEKKTVGVYINRVATFSLFLSDNGAGKYANFFKLIIKNGYPLAKVYDSFTFPEFFENDDLGELEKERGYGALAADISITEVILTQIFFSLDSSTLHLRSKIQTIYPYFPWEKYITKIVSNENLMFTIISTLNVDDSDVYKVVKQLLRLIDV